MTAIERELQKRQRTIMLERAAEMAKKYHCLDIDRNQVSLAEAVMLAGYMIMDLVKEIRGMPSHRPSFKAPGEPTVITETYPTHKLTLRRYCKYCYTTHRDWWQMPAPDTHIILCGHCEHTSANEARGEPQE